LGARASGRGAAARGTDHPGLGAGAD